MAPHDRAGKDVVGSDLLSKVGEHPLHVLPALTPARHLPLPSLCSSF